MLTHTTLLDLDTTKAKDIVAHYNDLAALLDLPQRPDNYFRTKGEAFTAYAQAFASYQAAIATEVPAAPKKSRANFSDADRITIAVDKNPKRLNTPAWKRWNALTTCVTVAEFIEKVGRREAFGDLNHAVKEGLVEITKTA